MVAAGDMSGLAKEIVAFLHLPEEARRAAGVKARKRIIDNYSIGRVIAQYQNFYLSAHAQMASRKKSLS